MSEPGRRDDAADAGASGGAGADEGGYRVRREELERLRLPRDGEGAVRPARRRGRWLLVLLLLAALGAVAFWRLGGGPLEVETVAATPLAEVAGEPVPVLSGSGYLVPAQPFIAVGSRVAGRIQRYRVEEGDRVEAGQPLVELDPTPFRAAADQARASLVSARAQRTYAEGELARARTLFDQGVLAQEELDRRESEARVARARVRELEAAVERTETDLADAVIRAPTGGVVLETYKQPGEIAVPGGFAGSGDLLRLANLSELRAELDVNEADLPRVHLGQAAEVVPDAFPERAYAARVVKLAPQIDRQKGTREIEVVVLEPDEKLLPDMSVRVVFYEALPGDPAAPDGAAPAQGVVVPRAALRRDVGGRPFVWVVRDGRAARAPVELGETLGERVVVREGVEGGEPVITGEAPPREGVRVARADEDASADAAGPE
ncbi:MAG: efflux RND transporter periplasmic adaptor subunit [Myxococcota bacterium]|nr:efflux RND transporter periplasmic adaptor subunit [Myxococcota bacterium]